MEVWNGKSGELYVVRVGNEDNCVRIDGKSGKGHIVAKADVQDQFQGPPEETPGIVGIVSLISGPVLITVDTVKSAGKILDFEIFQVMTCSLRKLGKDTPRGKQAEDESRYMKMLHDVYSNGDFYFSDGWNLTRTLDAVVGGAPDQPDDHFFWNRALAENLGIPQDWVWCLPMIRGFAEISDQKVNGKDIKYCLVSRQSRHRSGTRFNRRGIDLKGNVANFVETEQIMIVDENVLTYLQVRGSIPLFWEQRVNLKYMPRAQTTNTAEHLAKDAFRKHIDLLANRYEKVYCVNLVDNKRAEGELAKTFQKFCEEAEHPNLHYHHFAFHQECKGMKYENIYNLVDHVKDFLEEFGYTHFTTDGKILQKQRGIFRNNCMDCLDRTNVVQSVFARCALEKQLCELKIFHPDEKLVQHATFEKRFRNVWADNADQMSFLYSGTGALKTDFTRTGKRSLMGALQDGYNSALRYYLNNFRDGYRQDAISLASGDYVVNPDDHPEAYTSFRAPSLWPLFLLILGLGIFMIFGNLIVAPLIDISFRTSVVVVGFWMLLVALLLLNTIRNGGEYVDRPRFLSFSSSV